MFICRYVLFELNSHISVEIDYTILSINLEEIKNIWISFHIKTFAYISISKMQFSCRYIIFISITNFTYRVVLPPPTSPVTKHRGSFQSTVSKWNACISYIFKLLLNSLKLKGIFLKIHKKLSHYHLFVWIYNNL